MDTQGVVRTKSNENIQVNIQTLSALLARVEMSSRMGKQTYSGDRDINQALGYPDELVFKDFASRYTRQEIAKAIIDRPCNATWQGGIALLESKKLKNTVFEDAFIKLEIDFALASIFSRLDRLTGLGQYGVLLFGLDDVNKREDFANPVKSGNRKLIYLKPFSEESAKIEFYEDDPKNVRYGLPKLYNITVQQVDGGTSITIKVHHSRVLHIVDDPLESEVACSPRLESVFNRLLDIEKIVGGDAEMFWRGARPGYAGTLDKDFTLGTEAKAALKDQIDEYEHNLRRILITEGIDLKALAQQIADPSQHVHAQLQLISAQTGIPIRILTGSERGELASTQDAGEWKTFIQGRRGNHAEPRMVRPFVDKCIKYAILPSPETKKYSILWLDVFAISEEQRVKIGALRATALKDYTANPIAAAIITPKAFFELFLGLNDDQIAFVEQTTLDEITQEALSLALQPPVQKQAGQPGQQPNQRTAQKKIAQPNKTQSNNVI
jgi:hypothetical protein